MSRLTLAQQQAWEALDLGPLWMFDGLQADGQQPLAAPVAGSVATRASHAPVLSARATPTDDIAQLDWQQLQQEVTGCRRCGLCEGRQNTVFGIGDTRPNWLIIGEAPGAQEDKAGEPFVGEAGQLLDAMLAAAGARRGAGIFIVNVLKCRPPGNRDPATEEVASCAPFLHRQIELLQPQLIFTMGRFAAQALLQTESGIGALRAKVHHVDVAGRRIPLVAGYHPAYLLRRPEEKAKAWDDICLARSIVAPDADRETPA